MSALGTVVVATTFSRGPSTSETVRAPCFDGAAAPSRIWTADRSSHRLTNDCRNVPCVPRLATIVSAGMSTSGSHRPASNRSGAYARFIGITSCDCEREAILCCRTAAHRPQCWSV